MWQARYTTQTENIIFRDVLYTHWLMNFQIFQHLHTYRTNTGYCGGGGGTELFWNSHILERQCFRTG
jgi:hypothetical protein